MPDTTFPNATAADTMVVDADDLRALELVGSSEAANSLQSIASSSASKVHRKGARAALYRLSLKGVKPDTSASPTVNTASNVVGTQGLRFRTWASAFDGAGNRLVFVAHADPGMGKPTLLQFLTNDETGIVSFESLRLSMDSIGERVKMFEEQLEQGLALAEVPIDYGRWLIQLSRDRTRKLGKQSPPDALPWFGRIGDPVSEYGVVPAWSTINPEEIRSDDTIDRDGKALFEIKWYDAWFFSATDAYPWTQEWAKAEHHDRDHVSISPEQDKLLDSAIAKLMTVDVREIYARRLEETAHILLLRDEVLAARQGLYHALELRAATDAGSCSFVRALVRRSIEAVLELRRQQESVATPTDP